tara:strand:+ start:95 stop:505 length:411 start_codon:yes stop_codon:yes gene_type:complete
MITTILTAFVLMQGPSQELYQFDYIQDIESYSSNINEGFIYFTIIPQKGYKWSKTYNARLKLKRNKNVKLSQRYFSNKKKDFSKTNEEITVRIPYEITSMEDQVVRGTISFLLCTKTTCKLQKNVKVSFYVYTDGC